jgi:hypothetical protein
MIHTAQFGTRETKQSTNPLWLEIMLQEISRMTNLPYILINYDAKACCNQIIPDIAFQISIKYRVHQKIIQLVQSVLTQTTFNQKIGDIVT